MEKSELRSNSRVKDGIFLLVLISMIAVPAHFWISDRLSTLRFLYPVQSLVSSYRLSCSESSPGWMPAGLKMATRQGASPANQIAYLDPEGKLHSCHNGWQAGTFLSPHVNNETRFRYASLTKLLTADAILGLIGNDKVELDTKLVDVLDDVGPLMDERVGDITLEMLLRHSAGFDRYTTPDPLFEHYDTPWCPYDPEKLAEMELDFTPGERTEYSNVGYCLLGVVIERISGIAFRDYIESRYRLSDYGIKFVNGPLLTDEVTPDYRNSNFYNETYSRFFDFHALSSSAGLSGSASGLALLLQSMLAQADPGLGSADRKEGCRVTEHRSCYGFAFYEYQKPGSDLVVHIQPGFLPGVTPVAIVDSEGGITVLLTSGAALNRTDANELIYNHIYRALDAHYEL